MSVTIDSLDIQIRSSAGSAAANIDNLADALGRLQQNASLTKVSNNLTKLGEALGKLKVNSTGLSGIKGLAGALKSLAAVQKPGGLNSVLNSLKKVPEIVDALDPAKVGEFSTRIRQLASALAPLATQIDKVSKGFGKLPTQLSKYVTVTNRMTSATRKSTAAQKDQNEELDHQSVNIAASIANFEALYSVLQRVAQAMTTLLQDSMQWDGIQFRFGRAFGEDADEVYEHFNRIHKTMQISMQELMQYSSLYGSLLSGFGMAQEQVTTISVGLTELSYDIWAAYNDRYKSLEDASEAVRSAITGEIEPIRNAGIALTEASMQEYLDQIGMAGVSIEKLSEAQKAEVRYAVMMNAAMNQGIVGTYAREMNTAEGAVRNLTQNLKSLGQAFGSLFIPVLQKVLPYLIAFVQLLTEAVHWIASLFGIELFQIQWDSASGGVSSGLGEIEEGAGAASGALGDAADAAKKLKDYTMGFDELNVIDPSSASGGGGSGGSGGAGVGSGGSLGLDLDTLWDDAVFASVQNEIDKIKEKMRPFFEWLKQNGDDVLDIVLAIGAGFLAWKITTDLATSIKNLVDMIKDPSVLGKVNRIAMGITLVLTGATLSYLGGFDIGYEGPTLMNVLKTALGAALGIAGSLLLFGTGPLGWTVGIGVALTATVTGLIIGTNKRKMEEELDLRFGNVDLSDGMLTLYVDKLTAVPRELTVQSSGETVSFDVALDMYVSEAEVLTSLQESIQKTIEKIETYDFKIGLGVEVSQEDYLSAITDLVEQSQEYLDQRYLTLSIAMSFLSGDTGTTLSSTLETYYSETSVQLQELGARLKETVSAAFVDGEWIPEKLEEAKKIQAEIQEVLEYASEVEYRAKMQGLKLDVSGTDLTFESFQEVLEGANEAISEKLEALEEIKMSQLQVAVMDYDANIAAGMSEREAKEIYDQTVEDIEKQFRDGKIEIEYGTFDFGLETIRTAFEDAVAAAKDSGALNFTEHLAEVIDFEPGWVFDEGAGDVYGNIQGLAGRMRNAYITEIPAIKPDVRRALEETLEAMKPTAEEYDKIAEASRVAGKAVPENLRTGLNDYNELQALAGDADAINYMIGAAFSTDTAFLTTLATVEDAGKQIDDSVAEGLLNNLTYVTDQATGVVTGIENTLTGEVIAITPEMVDNFEQLGVDIADGLLDGADDQMQSNKKSWKDWAIWPWNWFKEKNEINSPSKLFKRGGEYLGTGLLNGITSSWTNIKTWFSNNIAPKLTLNYWKEKFSNIKEGFSTTIKNAVNAGIDLMNKFIGWLNEKLNFSWNGLTIAGKTVYEGGSVQLFTIPEIPRLENGGFLEDGLFTMNRGEIAGKFNNGKSVVANNEQIVEGIAAGVYQAVVAAMRDSHQQDKGVNVYLDGKQIYSSVKKTESERGLSLMGNQLGYSY